jgi:hypothetical protein
MTVYVLSLFKPNPPPETTGQSVATVSTVSKAGKEWSELSPFLLGPCKLYGKFVSKNMENAWQYSKVYAKHNSRTQVPTSSYWVWAQLGWDCPRAVRYPMGKGAKPEYSWWDGVGMGYISARKKIYAPLYAREVLKTEAFARLKKLYESNDNLILLDYDAYNHHELNMSLTDVLNNPKKKMGHAFVLSMLLTNDNALREIDSYYEKS